MPANVPVTTRCTRKKVSGIDVFSGSEDDSPSLLPSKTTTFLPPIVEVPVAGPFAPPTLAQTLSVADLSRHSVTSPDVSSIVVSSDASSHNWHPLISSGLLTASTGPASVVYSDDASDPSSHRARPLMLLGENEELGRRRRGFMPMWVAVEW
jgi:hypothetical protein